MTDSPLHSFLDDFTGGSGSAPDSSKWIMQTGTSYPGGPPQWGTQEVQTYTSSGNNIRQAGNGDLWIIPTRFNTNNGNGNWTSARLETRQSNFQAPVGGKLRVEARIKIPNVIGSNAAGYWPAFWALGSSFRQNNNNYWSWPSVGEIDIMENINGQDSVVNTVHCHINPGGICNEPNGLGGTYNCSGSRCPGNYHIYEIVIDRSVKPEVVKFWVDRKLKRTVSQTQLGSAWTKTVNSGFFLILNVAMGGAYPNAVAGMQTPTNETVSGREMAVDYVGVWST